MIAEGKYLAQYTFDGEGDLLAKKQVELLTPKAYMDRDKVWATWYVGYKSTDVYVVDFEGNMTKTTVKHPATNSESVTGIVTDDGNLEIYITNNKPTHSKFKEGKIDYIVIQYNPVTKSFKTIDLTDIPNIEGSTSFIGMKGDERCFVNWKETSKGNYKFQVLAVDEQKKVRAFAPSNFTYTKKDGIFVGGAMVSRRGGNWKDFDNIYYSIHTIATVKIGMLEQHFNLEYRVFRVNENEVSNVLLKVPVVTANSIVSHFPLVCFPESETDESTFFITDYANESVAFVTDFSSSSVEGQSVKLPYSTETFYYKDFFPESYETLENNYKAITAFTICDDGYARLILKTDKHEYMFYKEEIQK